MTTSPDLWLDMIATTLAPELRKQPWATPGEMAKALDRTTVQTPALELIDDRLTAVANGACGRLMLAMPPQEGKSQRTSRWFPLWMLHRNPNLRIAIVSYGHDVARRWGRLIREDLRAHPELGLTLSQSSQRQDEFELLGYSGGVVCVGVGGSLTSRPVDLLIIDDPYKNADQADSEAWNRTVREFWTEVAVPRLAPGAPVVIIQTRWRQEDLSGWLQVGETGDQWQVLNIPAQADHDPAEGETDPLGREPGEFLESARGRTVEEWETKRREVGSRSWTALYQGRPAPAEGNIFHRDSWARYGVPLWVEHDNGTRVVPGGGFLIQSWDMAFKDTKGSDFVVGQVWLQRDADCYLLDQVRGRWSFTDTCLQVRQLSARWPQTIAKLVEDKANGTAVMDHLRSTVPGLIPVEPEGGKYARAQAVSPLVEARNVWLPEPEIAAWVGDLVEEAAGFPTGKHDDQVDALTQALARLLVTINSKATTGLVGIG